VSLGLLGGGYITSVGHWYDAFHVVVPFFAALTILTVFLIKDPIVVKRGSLDMSGAATLGVGVFSLLLGLTQGAGMGVEQPAGHRTVRARIDDVRHIHEVGAGDQGPDSPAIHVP
jgi:hypothetical protein